jgi:alkanesulfonate monooxygenase SsuD/methylene tetrahydromethanopterin reductase-like flavin-dependent oxidoreductase (luciferase family)
MEFWSFGIYEGRERAAPDVINHMLGQIETGEQSGLDGVWLAEHHSNPDYSVLSSPNLLLAAISERTERIGLGTMCTVIPYQHPLRVVEELHTLDILSGGRLALGWGRGSVPPEMIALGVERSETQAMFDEGIEIVHRLMTGEEVSYDSKWWKGGPAVAVPGPSRDSIPEWMTAISKSSMDRAAQMGINTISAFFPEATRKADAERFREAWSEYHPGRPMGKFGFNIHVVVGETKEEALKYGRPMVDDWLQFFSIAAMARDSSEDSADTTYSEHGSFVDMVSAWDLDKLIDENVVIFGGVDEVIEQTQRLADSGVDMMTGWFQFGKLDYDFSDRSLQLFCDEVMPNVKSRAIA